MVIGTATVVVALLRAIALLPLRQARRARQVVVKTRAARNGNRRKRVSRAKHVKPASRANRVVDVKAASRVRHAKVANRVRLVKAVSRVKCASLGSRVNRVRTVVNAHRKVLKPLIVVNAVNVGNVRNGANAASRNRKSLPML